MRHRVTLVDEAAMIAAKAHRNQTRKSGDIPYIAHPSAIACELAAAGYNESCIAAAFLHDVVEDTHMTFDDLKVGLGARGARAIELARAATEPDKKEPWKARKAHLVAIAGGNDSEAAALIVADKHHNLRCLLSEINAEGNGVWDRMNAGPADQRWLYHKLVAATLHHKGPVFEDLRATVEDAFGTVVEQRIEKGPMNESAWYEVTLSRTVIQHVKVHIEATSEDEAREKAIEQGQLDQIDDWNTTDTGDEGPEAIESMRIGPTADRVG